MLAVDYVALGSTLTISAKNSWVWNLIAYDGHHDHHR